MAFVLKDRVKENSSTTGTGTLTLSGAVDGFQAFSAIGDGNTTYYAIVHQDGSVGEWETGIGTYTSSGTTLARTTVFESSNSGSAVSFSAGVKDVYVTYPSSKSVYVSASPSFTGLTTTGRADFHQTSNGTPGLGSNDYYAATFENATGGYGFGITTDSGTGVVSLQSQRFDSTSTAYNLKVNPLGAAVELYEGGTKRLETVSGGITVTGDITATAAVTGADASMRAELLSNTIGDSNVPTTFTNINADYYKWVLPAAGTYILLASWRVRFWDVTGYIKSRLYNTTDTAAVSSSERMNWEQGGDTLQTNVQITNTWLLTVDSADTIHHQAASTNDSTSSSIQSDVNGYNSHIWFRIS